VVATTAWTNLDERLPADLHRILAVPPRPVLTFGLSALTIFDAVIAWLASSDQPAGQDLQ